MRTRLLRLTAALALTIALASPAWAITFGQLDSQNQFSNVGALIGEVEVPDGSGGTEVLPFIFCTGTLIEDGDATPATSNLFLTAGHCVDADDPANGPGEPMTVTFDPTIDLGDGFQPVLPGDSIFYSGRAFGHPSTFCCGQNEAFDIAVVVLDQEVAGITPAPVATPNQLGLMSKSQLRDATFVAAGYGTIRDIKQKGLNAISGADAFDGDRRYVEQTFKDLLKGWLDLSMQPSTGDGGTCYGDSGGPHFLDGVVVSITSIGDIPCRATDKTYRIDTPVAQEFLAQYLGR